MTLRQKLEIIWAALTDDKRFRVLYAAATQQWHDKTCAECGKTYLAVGPETHLIAICDACELKQMEHFQEEMNKRFLQERMRGAIE